MSTDTTKINNLLQKSTAITWKAIDIHKIKDSPEKRKLANELGYEAVKYILELIRAEKFDIAIEISMTALQMFYEGHHFHQIISSINGLKKFFKETRLSNDLIEYKLSAQNDLKKCKLNTIEDRIDILYNLIWENGCLGTTDAIKLFLKKTNISISEPTIVSYRNILISEKRILSIGTPTGRPIEMFPNNSISLNRHNSYDKVGLFEGILKAKSDLFKPIWDIPNRINASIYEIENGNDPQIFALIEPGKSLPPNLKKVGGLSEIYSQVGVEGKLHSLDNIPDFGFKPIRNINNADFLENCRIHLI